jgi:Raf kinase inhibitor-like YbhB/YbcL family protein
MPQVEAGRAEKGQRLEVMSTAFADAARIPGRFTADGDDISPPLQWSDPPATTRSFAIVCDDPDAPSGTFTHWTAWDIQPEQRELAEAVPPSAPIRQGANDFGKPGYGGPKPPPGKPHRYRFRVCALDARSDLRAGATRAEFDRAIEGHVIAEGVLIGKYGR